MSNVDIRIKETAKEVAEELKKDHSIAVNQELQRNIVEGISDETFRMILVEEPAELIKAITKLCRAEDDPNSDWYGTLHNLISEMADVYIILEWLSIEFNIPKSVINDTIEQKNKRNADRWCPAWLLDNPNLDKKGKTYKEED